MVTVETLLKGKKDDEICTISPEESVFEAIRLLAIKNLGALLVVEKDQLVGIVSERDYARKIILKGRASKQTTVRQIMTTDVIYVTPKQTVEECMALMINKYIRHLPVLKDGQLIGIVSIGDVVKSVISEKQYLIDELEKYISGNAFTPMGTPPPETHA